MMARSSILQIETALYNMSLTIAEIIIVNHLCKVIFCKGNRRINIPRDSRFYISYRWIFWNMREKLRVAPMEAER